MTSEPSLRRELVRAAKGMAEKGLVIGSQGNVSVRIPGSDAFLITPTSLPYERMRAEDAVRVDGSGHVAGGGRRPSVEVGVHRNIYRARPDVGAVLHTHSPHASALAVLRVPIPPVLDEQLPYLGGVVPVAAYAPTGTPELAEEVCAALGHGAAVLMANHGALCVGPDLDRGLVLAELLERVAQIYLLARSAGSPLEVSAEAIERLRSHHPHASREGNGG